MADVPDAPDALVERLRDLDADGFIFRELIREAADRLDVNAAVIAAQHEQIDRLATFIMDEIPGEPSDDGSAVDCAIRLLREWQPDGACRHCDGIGCRACSAAFLAGSATPPEAPELLSPDELQALGVQKWLNAAYSPAPPEAPQQTALERKLGVLETAVRSLYAIHDEVAFDTNEDIELQAEALKSVRDMVALVGVDLLDAVAPTEADRP